MTERQRFVAKVFALSGAFLVVACVLKISTSSLSLLSGTGAPNTARVLVGQARSIRSDEWIRTTPGIMGRLSEGWTPDFRSIFDVTTSWPNVARFAAEGLQYPEREIVARVFGENGFFVLWWLPVALAFASMTALFMLWGLTKLGSVLGAATVVAIPTCSWWSYHPLELIWPMAMAMVLVEAATRLPLGFGSGSSEAEPSVLRESFASIGPWALVVLAGILLSRLPFAYIPWAIPVFLVIGALVIDLALWRRTNLRAMRCYIVCFAVFLMSAGFQLLVRWDLYQALAATVYPGGRRSSGGDLLVPAFSGAQAGFLQFGAGNALVGTNQSELAMGPLVILVLALALAVYVLVRRGGRSVVRQGAPMISLTVCAVLLVWSVLSWPSILLHFNPLVLLPAFRLVQILGVVAVVPSLLVFARLLPTLNQRTRLVFGGLSFAVVLVLSALAGFEFDDYMPSLGPARVVISAVAFAASVAATFVLFPRAYALAPVTLFLALSSLLVNPIVQGYGDLRDSKVASDLRARIDASTTSRVATDAFALDALAVANGFPMASGQIGWGPEVDAWKVIDERGAYEDAWNRGSSSMWFSWQDGVQIPVISNVSQDVVMVAIDPCSDLLPELNIGWIISGHPITQSCVVESFGFQWMNSSAWLYELRP